MSAFATHSAQPGALHSVFRIADAAARARELLEEDVGIAPGPDEPLADGNGALPLHLAAFHDSDGVVRVLLEATPLGETTVGLCFAGVLARTHDPSVPAALPQ